MTPRQVLTDVIRPVCTRLGMASPQAEVALLAIGLQESLLTYRRQINGPARGLWQFERDGGVKGVLWHPSSRAYATQLAEEQGHHVVSVDGVYKALEFDDTLACGFARLLLYTDPKPLPELTDANGMWLYYLRNWRPGRPHPNRWPQNHATAIATVTAAE